MKGSFTEQSAMLRERFKCMQEPGKAMNWASFFQGTSWPNQIQLVQYMKRKRMKCTVSESKFITFKTSLSRVKIILSKLYKAEMDLTSMAIFLFFSFWGVVFLISIVSEHCDSLCRQSRNMNNIMQKFFQEV